MWCRSCAGGVGCWAGVVAGCTGAGRGPIGHGAEAGHMGRENQSRHMRRAQSVSTEGEAVVTSDTHVTFLIG